MVLQKPKSLRHLKSILFSIINMLQILLAIIINQTKSIMKTYINSRNLWFFFVGLTLILFFSCSKDEFTDQTTLSKNLEGSWVEVDTKTDTIIFISSDNSGIFWFQRGYEIRNGYRLPIIGSTGYFYEIDSDSITLVDGLLSIWNENTYYFNFDKPNLTINIGNFSQHIDSNKPILTFRKIK